MPGLFLASSYSTPDLLLSLFLAYSCWPLFLTYFYHILVLFLDYSWPILDLFLAYSCPIPGLFLPFSWPILGLFLSYSWSAGLFLTCCTPSPCLFLSHSWFIPDLFLRIYTLFLAFAGPVSCHPSPDGLEAANRRLRLIKHPRSRGPNILAEKILKEMNTEQWADSISVD